MIQYGSPEAKDLTFNRLRARAERREDGQWIDVEVRFDLAEGTLPDGIEELTALIICTARGDIVQIVPQDEGRDCEFQFTDNEKAQLAAYYEAEVKPRLDAQLV